MALEAERRKSSSECRFKGLAKVHHNDCGSMDSTNSWSRIVGSSELIRTLRLTHAGNPSICRLMSRQAFL
jgi:hypothetical protein